MKVVIVGAGVAGLAGGWRLRQAGVETAVLERARPGRGATWAAAGMIAATAEMGTARTPESALAYRAREQWPDFASEIEAASGMAVGYRCSGSLMAAFDREEFERFRHRADADPELRLLDADAARRMVPLLTEAVAGALFAPREAQVDNRALGPALARAFQAAGGTLIANEAAVRIEMEAGRAAAVRTPFGLYEADVFVLAAGAWSGGIEGIPREAVPPVRPVKGEMIALLPPKDVPLPAHVVWGDEVYLVPRGGRLLAGATLEEAGFDTRITAAAEDWLSARALRVMPGLAEWKIDEHWAGLRPGSPDGLPILGPTTVANLFAATGQHRNGILFAPAVAEILRDLVLGRAAAPAAFDPRRFAETAG
jgi:glycine oxidase